MGREIVFPSRGEVIVADYSDEPLGDHEIRGRTITTLISQGTEMAWNLKDTHEAGFSFPIRPGYSAVFEVQQVGKAVTDIKVGDLRFCMGRHRSTQQLDSGLTVAVPEGLPSDIAVFARLMGVSMTTLMTTQARAGDKVIITGAGPVGFFAAHIFTIGGFDVSVVEPDALRRQQIESTGIRNTFAAMPLDDPSLAGHATLVVECSGHEQAAIDGCKMVREGGEVVLIGIPWDKKSDATAHALLNAVFFRLVTLRSGWEYSLPLHSVMFSLQTIRKGYNNSLHSVFGGFERSFKWLAEKRIDLTGLTYVADPENAREVYSAIAKRSVVEPFIQFDWPNAR